MFKVKVKNRQKNTLKKYIRKYTPKKSTSTHQVFVLSTTRSNNQNQCNLLVNSWLFGSARVYSGVTLLQGCSSQCFMKMV